MQGLKPGLQMMFSSDGRSMSVNREYVDSMQKTLDVIFKGEQQKQESLDKFALAAAHCGIEQACAAEQDAALLDQFSSFMKPRPDEPKLTLKGERTGPDESDFQHRCTAKLVCCAQFVYYAVNHVA